MKIQIRVLLFFSHFGNFFVVLLILLISEGGIDIGIQENCGELWEDCGKFVGESDVDSRLQTGHTKNAAQKYRKKKLSPRLHSRGWGLPLDKAIGVLKGAGHLEAAGGRAGRWAIWTTSDPPLAPLSQAQLRVPRNTRPLHSCSSKRTFGFVTLPGWG